MSDASEKLPDGLSRNADGSITVEIQDEYLDPAAVRPGKSDKAYQLARDEEKSAIKFRRIVVGDLVDFDDLDGHKLFTALICRLGDISEGAVRRMSVPDYEMCVLAVSLLRQPTPMTGGQP